MTRNVSEDSATVEVTACAAPCAGLNEAAAHSDTNDLNAHAEGWNAETRFHDFCFVSHLRRSEQR